MSPRLCIVTQFFPPEMGAPQGRLSELGERLIDRGWSVEALTALPNYPTGKIFEGYARFKPCEESVGRIRTIRVPIWPSKSGFAKRLGTYFSFVGTASYWGPRMCTPPDLLFVESPPLFIGYAARILAKKWRCGFVFNVSDLWPDSAVDMGIVAPNSVAVRAARKLELALYRKAAGITGQTDDIVNTIRGRAPSTPIEVITNSVDPKRFGRSKIDDDARCLVGPEPGPIFVYAGLLGLAQGLDQILNAAAAMPSSSSARFVLVGDGPVREHLEARIRNECLDRVRLLPMQPRERIPSLLAACDVALITLGGRIHGAVPNKIYEAMASSLPIVIAAEGEAARRVEGVGAGIAVAPQAHSKLVDACVRLALNPAERQQMGKAGRTAAETIYNRDHVANRLDVFLRSVMQENAHGR